MAYRRQGRYKLQLELRYCSSLFGSFNITCEEAKVLLIKLLQSTRVSEHGLVDQNTAVGTTA